MLIGCILNLLIQICLILVSFLRLFLQPPHNSGKAVAKAVPEAKRELASMGDAALEAHRSTHGRSFDDHKCGLQFYPIL